LSETVVVKTKGLLFDMDGVLISSIGSVRRSWRLWAKMYGVPDAENYEVPHGMRAIEIVKSLRPDIDAKDGLRVIEDIEVADTDDLKVLPGVKRLLEGLPPERWACATASARWKNSASMLRRTRSRRSTAAWLGREPVNPPGGLRGPPCPDGLIATAA